MAEMIIYFLLFIGGLFTRVVIFFDSNWPNNYLFSTIYWGLINHYYSLFQVARLVPSRPNQGSYSEPATGSGLAQAGSGN